MHDSFLGANDGPTIDSDKPGRLGRLVAMNPLPFPVNGYLMSPIMATGSSPVKGARPFLIEGR